MSFFSWLILILLIMNICLCTVAMLVVLFCANKFDEQISEIDMITVKETSYL